LGSGSVSKTFLLETVFRRIANPIYTASDGVFLRGVFETGEKGAGDNQKSPGKDNLWHTLFWGIGSIFQGIPVKMEASVVTALYRNTQRLLLPLVNAPRSSRGAPQCI